MYYVCFPPEIKCEWRTLEPFVAKLNEDGASHFVRERCLDVEERGQREPEALLVDQTTHKSLVIERKMVVWPRTYLKDHRSEHVFAEIAGNRLSKVFTDSAYVLAVDASDLHRAKSRIQELARRTCHLIELHREAAIAGSRLVRTGEISWAFCRYADSIYDDGTPQSGVGIVFEIENDELDLDVVENMRAGVSRQVKHELDKAVKKFVSYQGCQKVVLLHIVGSSLWWLSEDDLQAVARRYKPTSVDQVWLAYPEWVTDAEQETVYRKLV